ncbi:MAG: nucleoside triphosphate pyrophosphohydrolase [Alphaproteobacteria bacterium]|nr:nucleoside triphosphate pyrophosphohydrolase [Alphaproteobacteria bacterium]
MPSNIPSKKLPPIDRLIQVMSKLRDPNGGCPWDLEQDFKSIAPYTIEEAYEVAEAIDNNDMGNLREELGDLILQPIYHAQMASEQNLFDINDVINDITEKMIYRHPHVFGDDQAVSAEDVNAIWDNKKSKENGKDAFISAIDGVPKALPAALRAQKLQKKAAKTGFEWPNTDGALEKLNEELEELKEGIAENNHDHMLEEYGDLLFVMVNYGRMLGLNAEEALRQCNAKFEKRFKGMEDDFKAKDQVMNDVTLDDLLTAWNNQKLKA